MLIPLTHAKRLIDLGYSLIVSDHEKTPIGKWTKLQETPLTKEEFEGLKADLIENGCRDKIILWKEYIIDGHHRYAICTKHDIIFETMEIQGLETELDVKLWMIKNQIGK